MNPLPSLRSLAVPGTRRFSSTPISSSHIGKLPIPLPTSVTLDYPTTSISPNLPMTTPTEQRILTVNGPLGVQKVLLLPPVILDATQSSQLVVSVHDSTVKRQKAVWGLSRSLIQNAVVGVSEGYTVELRLVGVGYRATIEPIPQVFKDLQLAQPRKATIRKPTSPPLSEIPLPNDRLNIKLGYAHPVLIDIPTDIKVTVPTTTRIVLNGIDKQKLGLFAANIRKWRKPEPYRGKGIFVGDETIKLKEIKKK